MNDAPDKRSLQPETVLSAGNKRFFDVRKRSRRVTSISKAERQTILALWDATRDPDYVGERCRVRSAQALAVVVERIWDLLREALGPETGKVVQMRRAA